jgi:hypothetical protein
VSLVYFIRDQVFKPPRNLRHIPYSGYYQFIKSLYDGDSVFDRGYKYDIPRLNASGSSELHIVSVLKIGIEDNNINWLFNRNLVDLGGKFMSPILMMLNVFNSSMVNKWERCFTAAKLSEILTCLFTCRIIPKLNVNDGNEKSLFNRFAGGANIFVVGGHQWKAQRKVVNPAFRRSMPVKLFGKLGQDLFKVMDNMDDTVNVTQLLLRWTLDAIGKAAFGMQAICVTNKR